MRILVLGGTLFLGRHVVESARNRGHRLTLFHRGRTNPDLFEGVEELLGDREGGLQVLEGRRWDAVIDTCGYLPRLVKASARLLAGSTGHYTFVSSGSVYADDTTSGADESAAVRTLSREGSESVAEDYGALKALCELEVERAMPGRSLQVRFGLLVGPHDPTNRFTYWPRRIASGGDLLAPGAPERRIQFVDARDGAEWIVRMAEAGTVGTFNVTGPRETLTMGDMLDSCRATIGPEARLVWVEEAFLLAHGVAPWTDLPLWLPRTMDGALSVSIRKALDAGLSFRPLSDTIRETLAWDQSRPEEVRNRPVRLSSGLEIRPGLRADRESELLAAWLAAR